MSNSECIRCGSTGGLADVLCSPYDGRDAFRATGTLDVQFDAVLCQTCVNEVAEREIYASEKT